VLTVGGVEQPAQRVTDGLAPAGTRTVTFVAPRCTAGSTLRFELDAEDEVEESGEVDDVVERACPFT
jgi:subtilase family serine protease